MPTEVTFPDVHVEELPNEQHRIAAVPTSVAAFLGRALAGPTDAPVTISSFGDFNRIFGGLSSGHPLSYSVQDFFDNGGSQAVIARLFEPVDGDGVARLRIATAPPSEGRDPTGEWRAESASGGTVTLSGRSGTPMPAGWQIESFAAGDTSLAGTLTLCNGRGAALPGDQFTIGDEPDLYAVTGFTAATTEVPVTLAFVALSGEPLDAGQFRLGGQLLFRREPPSGVSVKAGPKIGGTSFVVGAVETGTIDIDDTFRVEGDPTVYRVRQVDSSGTVYFLPGARTEFGPSTPIAFSPPLSLRAANPGEWGNYLGAVVDHEGINEETAAPFKEFDLGAEDLFNLTLTKLDKSGRTVATERYLNVSVKSTGEASRFPDRLDRVLQANSELALVERLSAEPPAAGASAQGFGGNDGQALGTAAYLGDQSLRTGLYLLGKALVFNLLCIPPDRRILPDVPEGEQDLDPAVRQAAASYCADRRAFYIVDPPVAWKDAAQQGRLSSIDPKDVGITGMNSAGVEVARNAAVYFPRLWKEDILAGSHPALFAPSGAIAGLFAATDVARGVWKAPAGTEAGLANVSGLEIDLTDDAVGQLNPLGINCLRDLPVYGPVVWGARTLHGADQLGDDYKYVPVRRLALFIEESLYQGTRWAVFEANDEVLWSSLRLSANSFLADLARQGAFYDFAVTCDATTTTQADIDSGIVNIVVQIAPVNPAEFIVLQIQQAAGRGPG
jgi:hypothetical protein